MTNRERLDALANASEPRAGGIGPSLFSLQDVEGVSEILLVRHGQVAPDVTGTDAPLTDTGREQAEVLGRYLATLRLDAVISSPTRRCVETATAIAAHHGLNVKTDADLREVESYVLDGKTLRESLDDDGWEALRDRMRVVRRWDVRGEYGESSEALRKRMTAAIDAAVAAHPGQRIVLCTHGPGINAYIAELLGSPYDLLFLPRLTSVTVLWAKGDVRDLRVVNSMSHFGVL